MLGGPSYFKRWEGEGGPSHTQSAAELYARGGTQGQGGGKGLKGQAVRASVERTKAFGTTKLPVTIVKTGRRDGTKARQHDGGKGSIGEKYEPESRNYGRKTKKKN